MEALGYFKVIEEKNLRWSQNEKWSKNGRDDHIILSDKEK